MSESRAQTGGAVGDDRTRRRSVRAPEVEAESSAGFARTRPAKRSRDPLGKSSLFSAGLPERMPVPPDADPEGRGASHLFTKPEATPGTLVVDCSACGHRARITYAEFAALHFPVWLWIPSPARSHRHWLRCPTCHRFAWLRAGWLE